MQGSIKDLLTSIQGRAAVTRHFHRFLLDYVDEHDNSVYTERIKATCKRTSSKLYPCC